MAKIASDGSFVKVISDWIERCRLIESAAVFGSSMRDRNGLKDHAVQSDIDIHLIASRSEEFEDINWGNEIPQCGFCLVATRNATGGVKKLTVVFEANQLDLIVVPSKVMKLAAVGLQLGFYGKYRALTVALDEMATCLHTGYRFLKGERKWGGLYKKVHALTGVSMSDADISAAANASLCDALWALQKIEKGELVAAQYVIHSRLAETNLRLWRDLRKRGGLCLPSFGIGRHVETLASKDEQTYLVIEARLVRDEMRRAIWNVLKGLEVLMGHLQPCWRIDPGMRARLFP